MEKSKPTMSNEELIDEMLYEAEELKVREEVLDLSKRLLDLNPRMDRFEAIKFALDNAKLHAGIKNN